MSHTIAEVEPLLGQDHHPGVPRLEIDNRILPFLILYYARFTTAKLDRGCGMRKSHSEGETHFFAVEMVHSVAIVISIGFWSRLGDHLENRSLVLRIILSGLLLWLLTEAVCDGLFGGTATVYALLHAYAVDVSLPGRRALLFTILQGCSIACEILGGLCEDGPIGFSTVGLFLNIHRGILVIVVVVVQAISLLVVIPVLITQCRVARPTSTTASSRLLATMIAFGATVADLIAFIPSSHEIIFIVFGVFIPATIVVGLSPLLFSVGTLYFDLAGKSKQVGFVLGAMAGLQCLGEVISGYIFVAIGDGTGIRPRSVYLLTPALLAIVGLCLILLKTWEAPDDNVLVDSPEETSALVSRPAGEPLEEDSEPGASF
ncbi:hypothetical protein K435DRAFT_796282 [Dendrothele bispora CBS 962.96]|uniref:MFS general substrate transporter n=1 Tax=Dendrothele bispora (strain CBS 962.96) TaxID=1314807 RepID=A0A4S8M796_DENBC|nr:hypothetical protein K435DRAFT_796282 [Dendrothele bispora CBS 962.96]